MRIATLLLCGACLMISTVTQAQEMPEMPEPTAEHEWLKQFEGEWQTSSVAFDAEGNEVMKCDGTYSARMLGGFWMVASARSTPTGMTVDAVQTIGYDPQSKKYIGTWVDSMSNHMWQYKGSVDEAGKKLTLEAEGPNFMSDGKSTTFRDAYEFKSKDHVVATSSMQTEEGEWVEFMRGDMRRAEAE